MSTDLLLLLTTAHDTATTELHASFADFARTPSAKHYARLERAMLEFQVARQDLVRAEYDRLANERAAMRGDWHARAPHK